MPFRFSPFCFIFIAHGLRVLSVAVSTLQQHSVMPTAETAWPTDLNICYSPLQKAFSEPSYTIYTHTHPEICMHILLASYSSSHLLLCLTTLAPGPSGTFRAYPHLRGFYSLLQLLRASFSPSRICLPFRSLFKCKGSDLKFSPSCPR